MKDWSAVLSREERTAFSLRALYAENGYEKYRMSKLEEYDVYARNKEFLVSENVLTFTDLDGRLLAMKPDVTLSIIKNARLGAGEVMKVYYHENVYRAAKGTRSYQEIMQAGLECLGAVDEDALLEALTLAVKSLDCISESNVLELSHMGIVGGVLNACALSDGGKRAVLDALSRKDLSGIRSVAAQEGLEESKSALLERLATVYGGIDGVDEALDVFCVDGATTAAVADFRGILKGLKALGLSDKIRVDFSVAGNRKYYSGVAFQGYVEGIPTGVLSGGQYDGLMQAMGKNGKAVGFAVYLDELRR
ncbi:MAG: ATP phosphoribosyltransferase regulatory subunit [Clostridia bacterium]|nr:ATP phosphoribosyltransferase regulatory subunit [Clostridia bacterium]